MTAAAGAGVIRKRRKGLQVQVFAGRDPLTGRKRWLSRQVDGQTNAAWRQAKKVEAELLEQVDRGERRDGRSRTIGELVERWLEWRQQVRPISPGTVANYRGAIDRYILPNLGRAMLHEVDAATLDTLYARVRAIGGKCRYCWRRIRRGEPAMRAGVRYRPRPGVDETVHGAVLRLSWLLLVASVALSTLLQVAVAPPTLVGFLTAGATPVWLLGSFAVLSLLYRADTSADSVAVDTEVIGDRPLLGASQAPPSAEAQRPGGEVLTKRALAERVYADLSADGAPVSSAQLATAVGLSPSYARALVAEFQARPPAAIQHNGHLGSGSAIAAADRGRSPWGGRLLGRQFQDRTHLDRPVAGARDLGRQLQRLVQVVALHQVPAAELLGGLDRGAVADLCIPVADPNAGGVGDPQ
jgi:hypothetical protein